MPSNESAPQPQPQFQGRGRRYQQELIGQWYDDLSHAEERNEPVCYIFMSGNPRELPMSFGFHMAYPEINAAQAGAKHSELDDLQRAEDAGYSSDLCGYVKVDIGQIFNGFQHPIRGKLPKPSLVLLNQHGCSTYFKWTEQWQDLLGTRVVTLDVPNGRPIDSYDVKYVMRQMEELVSVCEEVSGRKFDIDRLREIMELSNRAIDGWQRVLLSGKRIPSPYDAFAEGVTFMIAINVLRGTPQAAKYYDLLVEEMEERIALGITPIPEEKFRIVLDGTPCWPALRSFTNLFHRWGAVTPVASYVKVGGLFDDGFRFDVNKPLESLAEFMLYHQLGCFDVDTRWKWLEQYYDEYHCDAVIHHSTKSCRANAVGMMDQREFFQRRRDIPSMLLESDIVDARYFSEAQARNRIDAFFEGLEQRKYYKTVATVSAKSQGDEGK